MAAIKLVRPVRKTSSAAPAQIGGYRKPLPAGPERLLRELAATKPGITLVEIQAEPARHGIKAGSLTRIRATPRRLGLRHERSR